MRVEIHSKNYEVNDNLEEYIQKKIKKLSKMLKRHSQDSAHIMVHLTQNDSEPSQKYQCEMILRLPPKEEMVAKDGTVNMFAAVDIAEAKLSSQVRKYKSKHNQHRTDRKGVMRKLRKMADRDFRGNQN